jgi:hypothetical protein
MVKSNNCRKCKIELTDKNWYKSSQKQQAKICKKCCNDKTTSWRNNPKNKQKWNKYVLDKNREFQNKLKNEIFELLKNKCANPFNLPHPNWCNDPRCLQIDHVNGGGRKHRNSFNGYTAYMKFILKQIKAGSKDYQLLCANCNWIKRSENNEIP